MSNVILLHTHSIMAFILAITQIGMLLYLVRLKNDTSIRRWMIINYLASVIWQIDQTIRFSLHPNLVRALFYKLETVLIYSPALAILTLSYFQILYLFLYNSYEKERKIMVRIVVPIALTFVGFNAWNEFENNSNLLVFQASSFVYGILTNIWALILSIRKTNYLRKIDSKAATAHKMLVYVNIGFIFMCLVALIFGFYSPIGYWTFFIFIWLCNLGQIIVYISFSAAPASFQIKIAGFSFVTVVSILTIVTLVFFPPLVPTDIAPRMEQQKGLLQMFIILAVATLFVVTVLPTLLRHTLTEPVKRLLAGVQSVNAGDLSTQVPVGSPDEIGELTQNFNQMTQSLKKANDQLREHAETLEGKVIERTASLHQSLENLKATQAQLVQSEKMASLGELTSGIAHEIQNPLNFVNNFSEVSAEMLDELKEEMEADRKSEAMAIANELVENLKKINHHGGRAAGIVKSMLEHSKASTGKRELTDINLLCKEFAHLSLNSMIVKNPGFFCKMQMDFSTNAQTIQVVKQDIGRVLQNVYNNAFYAVNEKSQQLKSVLPQYEPKVAISTHPLIGSDGSDRGIEIRIQDNGTGMTDIGKAKIFQPFYTTKPTGQGTGLGLSLSYDIITKGHGGEFLVESTIGEGTKMIIQLPGNS